MTEELKQYEKTIKRKHSLAWTPNYEEEITTTLNQNVLTPIVVQTFEKLAWPVVYQDENSVEAKRERDWWEWGNKITVSYEAGKIKIKSISLGNEFWDIGRNSKRVKLFIHAFQETEKSFDEEALKDLAIETEKVNNWDHYEIPKQLPKAKERREPVFWIPVLGGTVIALLLGLIVAFLSVKGLYFIGAFEVGVALIIGFAMKYLIKWSNYTFYDNLHYVLIGMVVLTYLSNQYFQYQIILNSGEFAPFSFWEFMQVRFNSGLTIKDLNTGWIGLVISWILQLGITYYVGLIGLLSNLTSYQLERVPMPVVEFAMYHFIKGKTEDQVRAELSKMAWTEKLDQNEVFESIGALEGARELNRME